MAQTTRKLTESILLESMSYSTWMVELKSLLTPMRHDLGITELFLSTCTKGVIWARDCNQTLLAKIPYLAIRRITI